MAYPADIQLNLNNDQSGQVVQQQVPAGTQTILAFKVEQSKVPEFFRQKGKDTITAIVFIQMIDDLARTNNWSNTVTHKNVANTLRGFPRDWLLQPSKCWTRKEISSPG
jgi:hypothetical protein